jgi:hypothetical protein
MRPSFNGYVDYISWSCTEILQSVQSQHSLVPVSILLQFHCHSAPTHNKWHAILPIANYLFFFNKCSESLASFLVVLTGTTH